MGAIKTFFYQLESSKFESFMQVAPQVKGLDLENIFFGWAMLEGPLAWLALGGLFYTSGVLVFVFDEKIKHGRGIWHLFVLAGSISHFICLVGYVS